MYYGGGAATYAAAESAALESLETPPSPGPGEVSQPDYMAKVRVKGGS